MTYERDYKKIILCIFGSVGLVIGTLFISFIFLLGKVNAASAVFSTPRFTLNYSDGTPAANLGNGTNQGWWGTSNYWGINDAFGQGNFWPLVSQWYTANDSFSMCSNSSYITISGQVAMLPNNAGIGYYSNANQYNFGVMLGGLDMSCSYSPTNNGWALDFQCTGKNGRGLLLVTTIHDYRPNAVYSIGVRKTFDYSCDTGPSEIIVNQNNNTNQIIENNNYWSNLMNNSMQQTKEFIADASVRHDIADGVLGADYRDNYGLNDIINLPLNLLNHLTDSCNTISLTIPYIDEDMTIQCPTYYYGKILSSSAITLISTIINAFVIYRFLLVIVSSVNKAKNPDDDKLEMVEL